MEDVKTIILRVPKSTWQFLRQNSVDLEKPMTQIVSNCIEKYKKNYEKKLTNIDNEL